VKKSLALFFVVACFAACYKTVTSVQLTPEQRYYVDRAMKQPLEFSLPKEQSEEAWARIQSFISQYASMKIQTATDYILETYNPHSEMVPAYAYQANRTPAGDQVNFIVKCFTDAALGVGKRECERNAHLLAHYAVSSELKPELIIR
jgi:hypothetical protein